MNTTDTIVTVACIAVYVGVCRVLFMKVWPHTTKRSKPLLKPSESENEAFRWPDHIFDRKDRK